MRLMAILFGIGLLLAVALVVTQVVATMNYYKGGY